MPTKLTIWNKRMLELQDYVVYNNIKGVHSPEKFRKVLKIKTGATITQIKNNKQGFTLQQIYTACNYFNISSDWVFGFTNTMPRQLEKLTGVDYVREGLRLLNTKA